MINALKLILAFLLKSKIIQFFIGLGIIILAASFGLALYQQALSGKCFNDIFGAAKHLIEVVK